MRRISAALLRALAYIFFRLRLVLLWQLVPQWLRRKIVSRFIAIPRRRPCAERPAAACAPYTIIGFASSEVGLGWTTRILKKQLTGSAGAPAIIDVSARFGIVHYGAVAASTALSKEPGTLIVNVNPHQLALALAGIPRELLHNKYIVGSFVWELETIPENWHLPAAFVDEIWVPTRFVASAFERAKIGRPIRVVPYRMEVPDGTRSLRSRFGIGEDRFVVLVSANIRSGMARKNVEGAIRAFVNAFPREGHKALLVVKIHGGALEQFQQKCERFCVRNCGKNNNLEHVCDSEKSGRVLGETVSGELREAFSRADIQIFEDSLDDAMMWNLVASCDVVLSMHRSEGFGLLLKQGLLLGKSVVATGWSGNVDFMTDDPNAHLIDYDLVPVEDFEGLYDGSHGAVWAEPRLELAGEVLTRLYEEWCEGRKPRRIGS